MARTMGEATTGNDHDRLVARLFRGLADGQFPGLIERLGPYADRALAQARLRQPELEGRALLDEAGGRMVTLLLQEDPVLLLRFAQASFRAERAARYLEEEAL